MPVMKKIAPIIFALAVGTLLGLVLGADPICSAAVQAGSIAAWLTAVGTVGALAAAVYSIWERGEKEHRDRRRHYFQKAVPFDRCLELHKVKVANACAGLSLQRSSDNAVYLRNAARSAQIGISNAETQAREIAEIAEELQGLLLVLTHMSDDIEHKVDRYINSQGAIDSRHKDSAFESIQGNAKTIMNSIDSMRDTLSQYLRLAK